ncbi:translation initiation factor IF-3 [Candidatus Daviesbacteria bacterium]|nr:translation initiation factor IF-3 [Candidatus Daviesbacteria bacterium]
MKISGGNKIGKFFRLNQNIPGAQFRVLDPGGKQIGILSKEEALAKAKELELDLIEIAPQANPPVVRIVDFQKFKYELSKKERLARKGSSEGGLKELWLSPRIADHDLRVRLNQAERFLDDNRKVKLTVKFKGREMAYPQLGFEVLQQVIQILGDKVTVEREPKWEGRKLALIITKGKGANKENSKTEEDDKQVGNNNTTIEKRVV